MTMWQIVVYGISGIMSLIISGSILEYLILYLVHGLFTETVRAISRWAL